MQNLIGQSIGRYHILEHLGQGGMAMVYKAYDTRLERDVAVKVIRKNAFSPDAMERVLKRFDREAKSLAKLTHPNIVSVIDYGEFEGSPYLVMPFLVGGTLKHFLGKPIPWQEAVNMLLPIADALSYAHQKGIVHRDVKPGNILITEGGAPMLTDFGIARLMESEESQTLTATGVGVGTPEYMSPEQAMGREVDGRSDVYSLGVVFFELVTGRKPYTADTPMAVVLKQMTDPLPDPHEYVSDLPDRVAKVLYKALAKEPADRYQTMEEFAKALKKLDCAQADEKSADISSRMTKPPGVDLPTQATVDNLATNIQPPLTPVPPIEPKAETSKKSSTSKKGFFRLTGNAVGIVLCGMIIVAILIGIASGWFKPKAMEIPAITRVPVATEAPAPTESPTLSEKPMATEAPTSTEAPLGIGSTQVSLIDGMTMVFVPAGEFTMGSPDGVGNTNEHPEHQVYLDAFWIDQTEVTNAMYEQCVNDGGCTAPEESNSYNIESYYGNSQYAFYPVINVDWDQANSYCQWTGRELPTEAQWEKAARGTKGNIYPWGNDLATPNLTNFAIYVGNTTKVGNYLAGASPYGALDMAGNVWEWVADWYGDYSAGTETNPTGPSDGIIRVFRGGSWKSGEPDLRGAVRRIFATPYLYTDIGFRCASNAIDTQPNLILYTQTITPSSTFVATQTSTIGLITMSVSNHMKESQKVYMDGDFLLEIQGCGYETVSITTGPHKIKSYNESEFKVPDYDINFAGNFTLHLNVPNAPDDSYCYINKP
mgnify:CR=1 FL=1